MNRREHRQYREGFYEYRGQFYLGDRAAALAKVLRRYNQAVADVEETRLRGGRWHDRALDRRGKWEYERIRAEKAWMIACLEACKNRSDLIDVTDALNEYLVG